MRNQKIEVARAALGHVRSGMSLGLGTGSTSAEFVKLLGEAVRRGELRDLRAVCTSRATEKLALEFGIALEPLHQLAPLDLAIDGADEIDDELRLIKGRGGALLREKIVEQAARRFIVIADESKLVARLGTGVLPVEVVPFAAERLESKFRDLGFEVRRRLEDGDWLVTDEGHRILDLKFDPAREIADVVREIRDHAGVVETGFFPTEATEALIATKDGVIHKLRP